MMPRSNVDIARSGFDAARRGDLDAIGDLLDPEVSWHGGDPAAPGACHNRDEALTFMRRSQLIGSGNFQLVDVVGAGEQVVVVIRPTGGDVVANLVTFRDGKVVEMVHYADPADALAAAGVRTR